MTTTAVPELLTAAKLAEAWGVPKSKLAQLLKAENVEPDKVKAGCSYYSPARLDPLRAKLNA